MKMFTVRAWIAAAGGLLLLAACATKTDVASLEPSPARSASAPAVKQESAAEPERELGARHLAQKGVCVYSSTPLALTTEEGTKVFAHVKAVGGNSIAIAVSWYQTSAESDEIKPPQGQWTPKHRAALGQAIDEAHRLGLQVLLKPHLEVKDGTYRGDLGASPSWFKNYGAFVLEFAAIGEKHHAEIFCIGTELENISYAGWRAEWENLIAELRKVYKGKLTYAANWTEYQSVCFWDQMDFIGIDSYFPLTEKAEPTQAELDKAWAEIADRIGVWHAQNNMTKKILFTEIGYQSADKTNVTPWLTTSRQEDQQEQAMALEALFKTMANRDWFEGLYYWKYVPSDVWRPLDFTIRGKKAEDVLSRWYKE
jgi:hypothetical protein